jgi:hypothetical protein
MQTKDGVMTPRQRQALSSLFSVVGESLSEGMTPAEAALLADPDDVRRLDAASRAALEPLLASEARAAELPIALASAAGPRCEAWVRMLPDTARQGDALTVIAEELWRPRRVSAVFMLIAADLLVLGIVGVVVAFFIAPVWNDLLASVDATIPMPTRVSIWIGEGIAVLLAVAVLVVIVFRVSARLRPSGALIDRLGGLVRRTPVVSSYLRLRQSVGVAEWLAVGGPEMLPLFSAMAEVGRPLSLGPIGRDLQRRLEAKTRLSDAMKESGAFQPGLPQIVRRMEEQGHSSQGSLLARYAAANIGREGPALDRLLLATHFVTAIFIGLFVFGLYLPIFKMGSVI